MPFQHHHFVGLGASRNLHDDVAGVQVVLVARRAQLHLDFGIHALEQRARPSIEAAS